LDAIGFVWNSHQVAWEEKYYELQEFAQRHGHCNVPTKYPPNHSLAIWVKVGGNPSFLLEVLQNVGVSVLLLVCCAMCEAGSVRFAQDRICGWEGSRMCYAMYTTKRLDSSHSSRLIFFPRLFSATILTVPKTAIPIAREL
jgi:Helicase associated domain